MDYRTALQVKGIPPIAPHRPAPAGARHIDATASAVADIAARQYAPPVPVLTVGEVLTRLFAASVVALTVATFGASYLMGGVA